MQNRYATEQEQFWAGDFGNEYIVRNMDSQFLIPNIFLFSQVLRKAGALNTCIEFGANIGLNIQALQRLLPQLQCAAVEINESAIKQLNKIPNITVYHQSIFSFKPTQQYDFVLSKGVLIHLAPESLSLAYKILYESAEKYICIAEYYSPTPVEMCYRGYKNKLFKRDFAGEMLERYEDLRLVDYGFVYHRDNAFPLDDITWFLLQKNDVNKPKVVEQKK